MNPHCRSANVPIQYDFIAFVTNVTDVFTSLIHILKNGPIIGGKLDLIKINKYFF